VVARVVLYSKPGCHLCDDMRAVVNRALDGTGVPLSIHSIAADLDLFLRYQHDIPVLTIDGREVARHRVDEPTVRAALRSAGIR
jgi:Glutaredoxin-like domain (DUF836)